MISNDFIIDFDKKTISFNSKSKIKYLMKELYSYLQDVFDEPENMMFDIPIEVKNVNNRRKYNLINGWKLDAKAKLHLL